MPSGFLVWMINIGLLHQTQTLGYPNAYNANMTCLMRRMNANLKYAAGLLDQLRGHSKHVIASYTAFRDDAEQRPSPLITEWPEWQHQISDTDPIEGLYNH